MSRRRRTAGAGPWFAVIDPASPRRAWWLDGFGADFVELEHPEPLLGRGPDGTLLRCYIARWRSLSPAQVARVCEQAGGRNGLTPLEIALEMEEIGIPILEEDVRVGTDPDAVRASFAGEESR